MTELLPAFPTLLLYTCLLYSRHRTEFLQTELWHLLFILSLQVPNHSSCYFSTPQIFLQWQHYLNYLSALLQYSQSAVCFISFIIYKCFPTCLSANSPWEYKLLRSTVMFVCITIILTKPGPVSATKWVFNKKKKKVSPVIISIFYLKKPRFTNLKNWQSRFVPKFSRPQFCSLS
jgi:hypothetical protein